MRFECVGYDVKIGLWNALKSRKGFAVGSAASGDALGQEEPAPPPKLLLWRKVQPVQVPLLWRPFEQ